MGGPIFTPDDEPYLGLPEVLAFDQLIALAMREQRAVAAWTHGHELGRLQQAAAQIVPGACSIALSIRELVRQGYLVSAMILLRPLVERVGALTYLVENPAGLELWEEGWSYHRRPRLNELLSVMRKTPKAQANGGAFDERRAVASLFNTLVHGGPDAARAVLIELPDGRAAFTSGKDLGSPRRAGDVSAQAAMYLVVLTARTMQIFPEVDREPD